eukprot:3256770-Prymnesium_polylepis.1
MHALQKEGFWGRDFHFCSCESEFSLKRRSLLQLSATRKHRASGHAVHTLPDSRDPRRAARAASAPAVIAKSVKVSTLIGHAPERDRGTRATPCWGARAAPRCTFQGAAAHSSLPGRPLMPPRATSSAASFGFSPSSAAPSSRGQSGPPCRAHWKPSLS